MEEISIIAKLRLSDYYFSDGILTFSKSHKKNVMIVNGIFTQDPVHGIYDEENHRLILALVIGDLINGKAYGYQLQIDLFGFNIPDCYVFQLDGGEECILEFIEMDFDHDFMNY